MIVPLVFTAFLLLPFAGSIPIDNGVEGEAEIECGPSSITVVFNTRAIFEGKVYVKGLYDHEECHSKDSGRQVAGLELPFGSCNVGRTRSLNPKGIFVTTTVVVQFHPLFNTKIDRAFRIQCFYMEADKTVSGGPLEVSEMTTLFRTENIPMPSCKYEILGAGPTGELITFAEIGTQVYHKWTCETESIDTYCMVVHSCTVDDGNGEKVEIIDSDGCALDKYLLNNIEYPSDLVAGQEAHVYKYADRPQLYYQCQISISIKEPNSECERPKCSEPTSFGSVLSSGSTGVEKASDGSSFGYGNESNSKLRLLRRRRRRDNSSPNHRWSDTVDVRAEMSAGERIEESQQRYPSIWKPSHCVPPLFSAVLSIGLSIFTTAGLLFALYFSKSSKLNLEI